uniref:Cilium assembly protein DZIP1 domain-containing protein n=1 Tax=Gopherus agassizii TaxID=38772 RepID=A0A452H4M0_9SAUR
MFSWQEAEKVHQREEEGRREFERWKEEERIKFQEEMDGLRQLFLTEFKDIASKNSALEGKLQELQAKNLVASNLGVLRDDDSDDKRQWALTQRELQGMREKTELQKTEWKKKLKELQKEHQMEKEEIRILSASKAEVTQETPKVPDLEESSEEADLEDTLNVKQRLLEALRRNPNLLKQFRPILEETLEEKLESMGVKRAAKGIPAQTYKNLSSLVRTQQQQKAKKFPNLLSLRDKLVREVTWKVKQHQKNYDVLPQQLSVVSAKSQRSPLSSCRVTSAQSRVLQAELQPYAKETPKPTPRSKASYFHSPEKVPRVMPQSKASSPRRAAIQQPSTPPFSSEEDSGGDHASLTPVKFKHPITLQQTQTPLRLTQNDETSSDWSDIDSSEGKASPAIGTTPTGTLVSAMAKKLEHTLSMPAKKPAGGKKLLPDLPSDSPKASHSDKKLQFVDENSDLETSSLEEITQLLDTKSQTKQQWQPAVRHSGDSTGSQGTSIWSSSSTRAGGW